MNERFCPHCMRPLHDNYSVCLHCGYPLNVSSAPHHLPIGSILTDPAGHQFLIGAVKGEGGFGITYIGKELHSGVVVAIKEYFPKRCNAQRATDYSVYPVAAENNYQHGMKSFLNEATMLRAVRGIPSCVKVFEFFQANGTAYMIMEHLQGQTLANIIASRGVLSYTELLPKLRTLIHDLSQLHHAGVIHRDIAPDNIIWTPDGTLKLLDFGCARSMEDGRSMTVMLKPGFAPVEQYQSRGQGPYTDLYALCATIYYCLTGVTPPSSPDRLMASFNNPPSPDPLLPPSAHGVVLPTDVERALMWGLEIQPTSRPQNLDLFASKFIIEGWVEPSKYIHNSTESSIFDVVQEKPSTVVEPGNTINQQKTVNTSTENAPPQSRSMETVKPENFTLHFPEPSFWQENGTKIILGIALVAIGVMLGILFA